MEGIWLMPVLTSLPSKELEGWMP